MYFHDETRRDRLKEVAQRSVSNVISALNVTGFRGDQCEENIDDCPGHLCQNGATCMDRINEYSCLCPPSYTGTQCELDVDECSVRPSLCHNGATCTNSPGSYSCICVNGWTGPDCSVNIDDCAGAACFNGATCIDRVGSFYCQCTYGKTDAAARGLTVVLVADLGVVHASGQVWVITWEILDAVARGLTVVLVADLGVVHASGQVWVITWSGLSHFGTLFVWNEEYEKHCVLWMKTVPSITDADSLCPVRVARRDNREGYLALAMLGYVVKSMDEACDWNEDSDRPIEETRQLTGAKKCVPFDKLNSIRN
ncbi:Neurogenic locus Notch protein [Eufriesea mexicana]|uniref:Neurogenic locus Notch protein n=1 Tax=Eufriesea mexicana TaxID=516756 RepID=A0A310SH75_9HYME|nr:Neurogenic locus Notch protein [Eufriesea mexicana]